MDRNQLTTIVITVTITVIFRELVTWFVSFVKERLTSNTTKQKVKTIFNKNRRTIIADILWLLYVLSILVWFVHSSVLVTSVGVVVYRFLGSSFHMFCSKTHVGHNFDQGTARTFDDRSDSQRLGMTSPCLTSGLSFASSSSISSSRSTA